MIMRIIGFIAAAAAITSAVQAADPPSPSPATRASLFAGGYLPRGAAPDSMLLNPLPPAKGSAALKRDEEAARAALRLRGTARWDQAAIDANLFTADATGVFSCAAGFVITAQNTPKLSALLRKAGPDLAMAVYPTKTHYKRPRPFMVNRQSTCTPQDETMLAKDGSYPSGHSAIGYGWGLILAELVPDRSAQLAARGRAFGDSRRICNVHWLSDIEEGRVVADAVLARLHAEPAFRADIDGVRAELAEKRSSLPAADCTSETAALAAR